MRRPIFGNGIPRNVLFGTDVTVLDTTTLDPKQTYALTLYMWWYRPAPPAALPLTQPTVKLLVQTDGGPQKSIGLIPKTYLETIWANPALPAPGFQADIRPLKILSKYMVRGNQQVIVRNTEALNAACFMWGYFEQAGEQDTPLIYRGLQPAAPVAPFSFPPVVYDILAGPANLLQPVHQLDPAYIDLVTLDAWTFVPAYGGGGSDVATVLILPGSLGLTLPTSITGVPFRIFDGIPMRAPNNTDTLIQLVAITPLVAMQGGAYGSFHRY